MIESVKNIIKDHAGTIMLCALFGVIGLLAGVFLKANEDGVYLQLSYGESKFTLGSSKVSVARLDLAHISEDDAIILSSKLYNLDRKHRFARELIEMRIERKGPFKPQVERNVVVAIDDSIQLKDDLGMACRESFLFGTQVQLLDVTTADSQKPPYQHYVKKLNVLEPKNISYCLSEHDAQPIDKKRRLWINSETARKWFKLNPTDNVPKVVIVTANILDQIMRGV